MSFSFSDTLQTLERLFFAPPIKSNEVYSDSFSDIYVTIEEAQKELTRRNQDSILKKNVLEYLNGDIPEVLLSEPHAVLFRNIITPTTELLYCLDMSRKTGFSFLGAEYTSDKFSTRNQEKLSLAKLPLLMGKDKNGNFIVQKKKIIDIKANENKPFRQILTVGNESLPHFHHCLLASYLDSPIKMIDLSEWVGRNGGSAMEYYKKFFAIFIVHGVLLETFLDSGSESKFTNEVVLPAFKIVENKFGLKPLVVKSIDEKLGLDYWVSYPGDVVK